MLSRKQTFVSVASPLLMSLAAFWVGSHRKEPAPVVVYKTAVYSSKTETQEPSPSPLNSEVERGTTSDNARTDSSETDAITQRLTISQMPLRSRTVTQLTR